MHVLEYHNETELNKGLVFTNLPRIDITEDYAKDYITINEAKRDSSLYKEVKLPLIYLKRQRERTRLLGEYAKIFIRVADETGPRNKITLFPSKIANPIIADGRIVNIDQTGEIEHKGSIEIALSIGELQQRLARAQNTQSTF